MSNMNVESSAVKLEEARQLELVQFRLERALKEADDRLQAYQDDIQSQKEYLWNSRDEMDLIEKISTRDSIQQAVTTGEFVLGRRKRMVKLRKSPYFGRFDFRVMETSSPSLVLSVEQGLHLYLLCRVWVHGLFCLNVSLT